MRPTVYVNPLPHRPRIGSHELVDGYLMRMTRENSIFDNSELKRLSPGFKSIVSRLGQLTEADMVSFAPELSLLLGREIDDVLEASRTAEESFPDAPGRSIQSTRIKSPRLCIECISTTDIPDSRLWQSAFLAHCPKHNLQLISSCPDCGEKLVWSPSLYVQCSKCGIPWGALRSHSGQSHVTQLEKNIVSEIISHNHVSPAFAEDLMGAILRVARPYDYSPRGLREIPYSKNLSKIISSAYWLITSYRARWWAEKDLLLELDQVFLFEYQAVPSQLFLNFRSVEAHTAYGSVEEADDAFIENQLLLEDPAFIAGSRSRLTCTDQDLARYLVTETELARMFGIQPAEVTLLASNAGVKTFKGKSNRRDYLYDLREVMSKVRPLLTDQIPAGYEEYEFDDKRFALNIDSYANVIGYVLSKRYQAYFKSSANLTTIFMDPVAYENASWQHIVSVCAGQYFKREFVAKVLDAVPETIDNYIHQGYLKIRSEKRSDYITGDSLKSLIFSLRTHDKSVRARKRQKFATHVAKN